MKMWPFKSERRSHQRLESCLSAVFRVVDAWGKPLTPLMQAHVMNLSARSCCLALPSLRTGGFHLRRCLEEKTELPLDLTINTPSGGVWELSCEVRWLNQDLSAPKDPFRVGVKFDSGQKLPRGWRRQATGSRQQKTRDTAQTVRKGCVSVTLTKDHIIARVFEQTDLPKVRCRRAVEAAIETIKSSLVAGEDVLISNFGKFSVCQKAPRKGRNPQTGEALMLRARKVVTFRCSHGFRKRLNGQD